MSISTVKCLDRHARLILPIIPSHTTQSPLWAGHFVGDTDVLGWKFLDHSRAWE